MGRRMTLGMGLVALAVGTAAMLGGCCTSAECGLSPSIVKERESEIVREDARWSGVAGTKDAAAVAAFYADDAVVYPPNSPMIVGRAGAERAWGEVFALPEGSISWSTVHSGMARAGDVGYTSGTYVMSFKGPDGKAVRDNGKFLCIWKRQADGSWKSIHDMWNTDLPMGR